MMEFTLFKDQANICVKCSHFKGVEPNGDHPLFGHLSKVSCNWDEVKIGEDAPCVYVM